MSFCAAGKTVNFSTLLFALLRFHQSNPPQPQHIFCCCSSASPSHKSANYRCQLLFLAHSSGHFRHWPQTLLVLAPLAYDNIKKKNWMCVDKCEHVFFCYCRWVTGLYCVAAQQRLERAPWVCRHCYCSYTNTLMQDKLSFSDATW